MNLFIYGAGGHAKVVATAAFETNSYEKIYFLDSAKKNFKFSEKSAIFSLNPEDDLLTSSVDAQSIIAIGDSHIRMKIALESINDNFISIQSPNSYLSQFSKISEGVFISAGAMINADSFIGPHAIINTGSVIEHDCKIGSFSHVGPNAALGGNVELGSNVFIGGGAFVNPNLSICNDVTVGSGSVVINDISEPGIYAGVPANKIK
jgi:sugar O-acyltransferase (sialic acid O-acetyltransferase NeuD family)